VGLILWRSATQSGILATPIDDLIADIQSEITKRKCWRAGLPRKRVLATSRY